MPLSMPRFAALQVCPAADLNELATQIERDVECTPAHLGPVINGLGAPPAAAKAAMRAFGVAATSNTGGYIDITWPPLAGLSALLLTPTSANGAGSDATPLNVQLLVHNSNPGGASIRVLTAAGAVQASKLVSFSVLAIGWVLD